MQNFVLSVIVIFLVSCNKNHCTNGVQDANETGVDCGGDCQPCIVSGSGGVGNYPSNTVHCTGTPTAVVDVTNPITGRTWMDRNLGASQVATSITDTASFGDFYQWGRAADGHQCKTSPTTSDLNSSDDPGHGNFIIYSIAVSSNDWRNPKNDNLWQGVNGINNPCPSGYRIPTAAELSEELDSWNEKNSNGAFASPLKLPASGVRSNGQGQLVLQGVEGFYWSSNVSSENALNLGFNNSGANIGASGSARAAGFSIRCIKD